MEDKKKRTMGEVILLFITVLGILSSIVSLYSEANKIGRYNVVWTSPSKDAAGSMPLGSPSRR